ncbi:MAG: YrbL family protein [bacterium]
MKQPLLQLHDEPIGAGKERVCYRHPDDPGKVVKIQKGEVEKQTRRELSFYRWMQRRNMNNFKHLPRFYGQVETNLGRGFVVDLVSDYDGTISKSLYWHFERGYSISEFIPYLEELRQYLVENLIVFSVDMSRFNVLFNRVSNREARLVVIDGLGNHSAINWLDEIPYFARRKIKRRWDRFFLKLQYNSETLMKQYGGSPRVLDRGPDV